MHSESSESLRPRRFQITKGKVMAGLFASLGTLALAGLVVTNLLEGWNSSPPAEPAHPPQTQPPAPPPSPSPTSPSQPATPPRALAEREVRNLDCRGLTLDTSSESYFRSYLHGVTDSFSHYHGIQKPDQNPSLSLTCWIATIWGKHSDCLVASPTNLTKCTSIGKISALIPRINYHH